MKKTQRQILKSSVVMWDHLVILDFKTVCDFSLIDLN